MFELYVGKLLVFWSLWLRCYKPSPLQYRMDQVLREDPSGLWDPQVHLLHGFLEARCLPNLPSLPSLLWRLGNRPPPDDRQCFRWRWGRGGQRIQHHTQDEGFSFISRSIEERAPRNILTGKQSIIKRRKNGEGNNEKVCLILCVC